MARRQGVSHPEDSKNFGKVPKGKKSLFCMGSVKDIFGLKERSIKYVCQNMGDDELVGDLEKIAETLVDSRLNPAVTLLVEDFDAKLISGKIIKSRYEESPGNIWHIFIPFEGDPYYLDLIDENQFIETVWFEKEKLIGLEILDPTGDGLEGKIAEFAAHVVKFCKDAHQIQLDSRDELLALAIAELEAKRSFLHNTVKQTSKLAEEGRLLTKNQEVPRTFEAPLKKKIVKPAKAKLNTHVSVKEKAKLHFAMQEADYGFINEILWGMGLSLERCSDAVRNLDEESLRDIIKAPLNLHYSAAAGEAFNHTGKTDIYVCAEDGVILYIAECKKYDGPKTVSNAITQLFKNLVWRDRMCSLIIFNIDRNISTAIDGVRNAVEAHPLFVKVTKELGESNSQFICLMKLSKDESIQAKMTVQVFDLSSEI